VPTGIAIAAPLGSDVQIRPRSGLSARGVMGTLGTIDADYRGELFVTMYCLPDPGRYVIQDGERIAQLVVSRLADVEWGLVETLDATERGERGHGSTGRS
jgi:dUTP pyrophosphatase